MTMHTHAKKALTVLTASLLFGCTGG